MAFCHLLAGYSAYFLSVVPDLQKYPRISDSTYYSHILSATLREYYSVNDFIGVVILECEGIGVVFLIGVLADSFEKFAYFYFLTQIS